MLKGGGGCTTSFVLTQVFEAAAVLTGRGRGTKRFHPLKGGTGMQQREGGGGGQEVWDS